jgi:predicted small secreted protein
MKVFRLIQVVLMIATLGLASLSLSACGDMNTSGGASSSGTSGSSGGY